MRNFQERFDILSETSLISAAGKVSLVSLVPSNLSHTCKEMICHT